MNASIQRLTQLWSRAEIRLALAGVAGLLAVYLGFMGVSVAAADRFIKHASRGEQLKEVGLDATGIARSVRAAVEEARTVPAEATPLKRTVPQMR